MCSFYQFLSKSYIGEGLGTRTVHLLPVSVEVLGRRGLGMGTVHLLLVSVEVQGRRGLGTGTKRLLPVSVEVRGRKRTGYRKFASSTSFSRSPW